MWQDGKTGLDLTCEAPEDCQEDLVRLLIEQKAEVNAATEVRCELSQRRLLTLFLLSLSRPAVAEVMLVCCGAC
jgi:hypothetical protein